MSTKAHTVCVRDADPCGYHVVHHPRKAVDAKDGEVFAVGSGPQAGSFQAVEGNGTARRPSIIGQKAEDAFQVDAAGECQPV